MSNNEYIKYLIKQTIDCPSNMTNDDIIVLYNNIQEVFKSNKYTIQEKEMLHKQAHLESLAMIYDGIK